MPTAIRVVDQFIDLTDTPASFSGAGSQLVRVNAGATALEFLDPASDFATQYALLAGRSGGSTLYGGTAANDDLTLEPTSHATKTTAYVLLAPSGGNVGIGTTTPNRQLEVNAAEGMIRVTGASGRDAVLEFVEGTTISGYVGFDGENNLLKIVRGNNFVNTTGIFIHTSGNVGIGTTTPSGLLHAYKDQNAQSDLRFDNPNSGAAASAVFDFRNGALGTGDRVLLGVTGTGYTAVTGWGDAGFLATQGNLSGGLLLNANAGGIKFETGGNGSSNQRMVIDNSGNVGIGAAAPDTLLHVLLTDAGTNAVVNVLTAGHESSGTPAAGFGIGLHLTLESSTTAKQSAALLAASWIVATHASRTARLALSAYDYGGAREGIRIDADGSQALLSFYGVAATARQLLATGAGATVDQVITALQTLGLLKQS